MADTATYLGAGLLAGFGKGAMDFALESARQQKQETLLRMQQEFQSGEAEKNRAFQTERDTAREQRDSSMLSGAPIQDESGNYVGVTKGGSTVPLDIKAKSKMVDTREVVDNEGKVWTYNADNKAVPVLGVDGNQLTKRAIGYAARNPAEIQTAEWLADRRAAAEGRTATDEDYTNAYDTVKQARTSPTARAQLVTRIYGDMKKDVLDDRPDAEKQAAARKMVDDLIQQGESARPRAKPIPAAPNYPTPGQASDPGFAQSDSMNATGDLKLAPPPTGSVGAPHRPTSQQEFQAIKPGELFVNPADGKTYRKK